MLRKSKNGKTSNFWGGKYNLFFTDLFLGSLESRFYQKMLSCLRF
jgi:hypothetical protein